MFNFQRSDLLNKNQISQTLNTMTPTYLHHQLMSICYWQPMIVPNEEKLQQLTFSDHETRARVIRLVLVLFIYILNFGMISKYNLKHKISKCLLYLKSSMNIENLQEECQYAWDLANWLYHLRAITLIDEYKTDQIDQLSVNQIKQIFQRLIHLTTKVGRSDFLKTDWVMVNIFIKGKSNHKFGLAKYWFVGVNTLQLNQKKQNLIRRYRTFVDSVSMYGKFRFPQRLLLEDVDNKRKKRKAIEEILSFLCLTHHNARFICQYNQHPFALKNLCCLKECWYCHKKIDKLKAITINGVKYSFCSDQCKSVSYYCQRFL